MYSLLMGYTQVDDNEEQPANSEIVQTLKYPHQKDMAMIGITIEENVRYGFPSPDFFTCQNVRNKLLSVVQHHYGDNCLLLGSNRLDHVTFNYLFAVPINQLSVIIVNEQANATLLRALNRCYDKLLDGNNRHPECVAVNVTNYLRNECLTCNWIDGRLLAPRGFISVNIALFTTYEEVTNYDDKLKRLQTMDKVIKKNAAVVGNLTALFC